MNTYPANKIQEYLDKLGRQLLEQCIVAAIERDGKLTDNEVAASKILEPGQECWYYNPSQIDSTPMHVSVVKHGNKKVIVRSPDEVAAVKSVNQISLKYLHPLNSFGHVN